MEIKGDIEKGNGGLHQINSHNELPAYVIEKIKSGNFNKAQIDYIVRVPWNNTATESIDISFAKKILEESHYGMENVKQQIMRYIACQKHLGKAYGDVLLLVGPPGVGKTSIAKAIAKAMKRPFVKIPLAGVSDAGPLRGYDSNYQNPKPGLIVEGLIDVKSMCPLVLLDEIDKLGGSESHGYPEHVLLHVLDSDRSEFIDDMIQMPIDLSNIVFLATANSTKAISPILLNRLEIIQLDGYSKAEKMKIIKDYIVPDLTKELSIEDYQLEISEELIEYLVEQHVHEPGIRSLKRNLKLLFESVIMKKYIEGIMPKKITITEYCKIMGIDIEHKKRKSVKKRNDKKMYNF